MLPALHKMLMCGGEYIPKDMFKAVTYTGTGAERAITGIGFQPDFVWIKCRSIAQDHMLVDNIRGATITLFSNSTSAQSTVTQGIMSLDSDGFTVGTHGNVNQAGATYVAWCWKADNSAGVSNTNGSITSTVNAGKNFSIVEYTGTGNAGDTVGHGLPVAPNLIIVKRTDTAGTDWMVYQSIDGAEKYLRLNTTAHLADGDTLWNDTEPTDEVFSLGTYGYVNGNGFEYIAYCFADLPGVSKIGSYIGTGAVGNVVDMGTCDSDEEVTNGGFDADTDWIKQTGWTIGGGEAHCDGTQPSNSWVYQAVLTVGKYYRYEFEITSITAGNAFAGAGANQGEYQSAVGVYSGDLLCTTAGYAGVLGDLDFIGSIDNISFKEITGQDFQPAYVKIKRTDTTGDWVIIDNKRDAHNPNTYSLLANSAAIEAAATYSLDLTATGFELNANDGINILNGEYIFLAFAELPQKDSPENRDEPLFNIIAFTGDGVQGHKLDGLGCKPDYGWFKNRVFASSNLIFDSMRGVGNYLAPDLTQAEAFDGTTQLSFDSNGLTIGSATSINYITHPNILWAWNAGGEVAPNEEGSVYSDVMANVAKGFSIVRYTGTGTTATIGHGLDSAPEFIVVYQMNSPDNHFVYFPTTNPGTKYMMLNLTNAESTGAFWNSTDATASVFSVDTVSTNVLNHDYVAYCFHSVAGVSDFGTYSGTGAELEITGVGFEPDYVMIKRTDVAGGWYTFDSKRGATKYLFADSTAIEATDAQTLKSFTSDGFVLGTTAGVNASGGTYIYKAFKIEDNPDTLHQIETGNLLLEGEVDPIVDTNSTHTITQEGDVTVSDVTEELVSNGGFDSTTTGWTPTACTIASVSGGLSGNCLEITRVSGTVQWVGQATNLVVGKTYKVKVAVKSGTSGDDSYSVYSYSVTGGWVHILSGTTSGTWVEVEGTFVASASTETLYIGKNSDTAGTMLYDEVSCKQVSSACGLKHITFDGTGDYLSTPDHADWDFGTGDYTVDTWFNLNAYPSSGGAFALLNRFGASPNKSWRLLFYWSGANYYIWWNWSVDGSAESGILGNVDNAISLNSWNHAAAVRSGNTVYVYMNGILLGSSATAGIYDSGQPLYVGSDTVTYDLNGYLDQARITKGTALWTTTNFNLTDKGLYYPSGTLNI